MSVHDPIPHAAAIANTLAEKGGLRGELVHRWYGEPRGELDGFTPRAFLEAFGHRGPGGERVLQLARTDVAAGWPNENGRSA